MLPVMSTTIHMMKSSGNVRPFSTISRKTPAGMARMMRKNTDTRFRGPRSGRTGRAGYSTSSKEKGG